MSRDFARSRRIGEEIQRALSNILLRELKDPRVKFASITAVKVSGDLSHAWIYFSLLDPDADPDPALEGLKSASGFMRRQLGRALKIRHIPQLHFSHDNSIAEGARLTSLIDELVVDDRARQRNPEDDEQS